MERLTPLACDDLPPGISLEYTIVGGFNNNAVRIFWKSADFTLKPVWVMLRTFTGHYTKYPGAQKYPPLIFPLSDEDAYVYCDRPECERCVFRCKKGFIAYVFFADIGLVELPLDKISDYFKTRPK